MARYFIIFFCLFFSFNALDAKVPHTPPKNPFEKFLANRLPHKDKRYESFLTVLKLLKQRHAVILVETGTSRGGISNFEGDGGSTIIFGHWASKNDALLYSVDISLESILIAQAASKLYEDHIQFTCEDSLAFLREFNQPIDFLYLDSYDFEYDNPAPSQEHHLKEIQIAYPYLHADSVVMIDDCELPHGGKGKLVIEYLLDKGWEIVFKGYQVILIQP